MKNKVANLTWIGVGYAVEAARYLAFLAERKAHRAKVAA